MAQQDFEVQVRYSGGALKFFSSIKEAYDFSKRNIHVVDKISWSTDYMSDEIRIRPKFKTDVWMPSSEEKITILNPAYQNAQPNELFWVHQKVFLPNPSPRQIALEKVYQQKRHERTECHPNDWHHQTYWQDLIDKTQKESDEPMMDEATLWTNMIVEVWTDQQFVNRFCT